MPELFDVSLIVEKHNDSSATVEKIALTHFALMLGENTNTIFSDKTIIFSKFDDSEVDFIEYCFSFENQTFHQATFDAEFQTISNLINTYFIYCSEVKYALCSYELNGYFLLEIKNLLEINRTILGQFPIYCFRAMDEFLPKYIFNFQAQKIFISMDELA